MVQRILVVDDDREIVRLVRTYLEKSNYEVLVAYDGEMALHILRRERPDLVLLDLMLPGRDGQDVTRVVRGDASLAAMPIIMLTARVEDHEKILGLELGADDYVTKPFSPRVLVARVRATLRRKVKDSPEEESPVKIHNLEIHPGRREVLVEGKRVRLTFTEFAILNFLARRPGWVFTRFQIVDAVRGDDYPVTDRSVDVQIVGLRKKLGSAGKYIETVRGVGYRFQE